MARKTAAQLNREIAEALSQPPPVEIQLRDRYSGSPISLVVRGDRVVGAMGTEPKRYLGMTLDEARHYARHGGQGRRDHATIKLDNDDARMFGRYARRMEQTRAQALVNARTEGFAEHQLGAVEEGWHAERSDTIHGGFPSAHSSHATRRQALHGGFPSADSSHATRRRAPIKLDTSVYRRLHGAEPRGSGNWTFVIGKREYAYNDDPAIYRPAESQAGYPEMSFARARDLAIAEARRRGAVIVGVAP